MLGNIKKDKCSDKIAHFKRLTMKSSDTSDGYKYFVSRREWMAAMKNQKFERGNGSSDSVMC